MRVNFETSFDFFDHKAIPCDFALTAMPESILRSMLRKEFLMARYGKSAQRSVKRAMHKLKEGNLKSGKSGKRVKSREQAIAIGLSEARAKGAKLPAK
jgi:predicted RNA-binding Zn ribbon-like protein